MKKILLMCLIALGISFTSCTVTKKYIAAETLEKQLEAVDYSYNNLGFTLSGKESDYSQNLTVTDYNYSQFVGITPILDNDVIYHDTYTFTNSNGNNVTFTVQYKIMGSNGELDYVSICGCRTDNSDLYNKLCNNQNLVKVNYLPRTSYKYNDDVKTAGAVCFVGLGILLTLVTISKL